MGHQSHDTPKRERERHTQRHSEPDSLLFLEGYSYIERKGIHIYMESFEEVVIVGGGIAGLATAAVALKRVGVRSLVLEHSHELRATGGSLTLFPNAWRALEAIGVAGKLVPLYLAFKKFHFTNLNRGGYQEASLPNNGVRDELGVRAVHRKLLLEALAEELPSDAMRFSSKLESIKDEIIDHSSVSILQFEDGSTIRAKDGETLNKRLKLLSDETSSFSVICG
ncbi:hypothetical protein QJS10_CPB13g01346 [Acorus calamus]|uniref:FAD-binding domain-containing protein n=1 Tax=Acorus calamus TaxID=4465 RepID=A0AAV9DGL6_ACOCL|nr:hypothetical protein QJS10_CPB13g01346 [Acorus calamus]